MLISELIGGFGTYHLGLCVIIFISKLGIAFHQMAIIFLAPPIDYHCPDTNNSCCETPIFDNKVFSRTIVTEWKLICQKSWLKDFNQTLFQLGFLLGSLFFGIASDRFGRRPTLLLSAVLEIFTGIMTSFLPDYWSFTIVRTILGFMVGGVNVIGFVLIMEFVGTTYRDIMAALYHLPFTMGHILMALIGYYVRDYMYFQLTISLSTLILLIYICFLPESPRWLLAQGKTFEACALMERVAKINRLPCEDFDQTVTQYQLEHREHSHYRASFIDLFKTPNIRRNLLVISFSWLVCSYCFYGMSQYISHLTGDLFINVMACGSVCFCGCFLAIPVFRFMKRKTVMVVGHTSTGACVLVIALVPEGKVSVVFGCTGVLLSYVIFIFVYLYCSEMFPTPLRNAGLGITSMMARVGSMFAPFVAGLRPRGQWCAPVAFGILPLIGACLSFLLPETKNRELPMTIEEGEILGKERFYVLYCPCMYLMFFNHKLYRKVIDVLFALWELYPVALFQCCCGTELHHFGDYMNPNENTIIVLNHRTRVDWNYVWIALYHATQDPNAGNHCICRETPQSYEKNEENSILDIGGRSKLKIVLKDEMKFAPGLGWIMQLGYFLYVKRNWQEDSTNISRFLDYYGKLQYNCRLVLFPEGTDLSENNRINSNEFAVKNKLQQYEYVLHPRTTGWAVLCFKLKRMNLESVYDVTVAYDNPAQTEVDVFKGLIPKNVYFHFKRYSIGELPSDEAGLRNWLANKWQEKELSLRKFHKEGNFMDSITKKPPLYRTPRSLGVAKIAFVFWTIVDIIFTYSLLYSTLFQFWVFYNTLLFTFVTWYFGGFHNIQYQLLDKINKSK